MIFGNNNQNCGSCCNSGCGGNDMLLLLLLLCGGFGGGGCGCNQQSSGCGCGGGGKCIDMCELILLLVLLSCFGGSCR